MYMMYRERKGRISLGEIGSKDDVGATARPTVTVDLDEISAPAGGVLMELDTAPGGRQRWRDGEWGWSRPLALKTGASRPAIQRLAGGVEPVSRNGRRLCGGEKTLYWIPPEGGILLAKMAPTLLEEMEYYRKGWRRIGLEFWIMAPSTDRARVDEVCPVGSLTKTSYMEPDVENVFNDIDDPEFPHLANLFRKRAQWREYYSQPENRARESALWKREIAFWSASRWPNI